MSLVSMRQLLDHAAEHGYGIPAFNVTNLEQVQAIIQAQASRALRLSKAQDILLNDRDLGWMKSEVERLHDFYLNLRGAQS